MPTATAIYCRISQDSTGTALGVARQEKDCRQWAERQGWTVADVLIDNDRSAYSGRRRPEYQRLLEGIEAGTYDSLVTWHPDRLHRSPVELEAFIELVERHHLTVAMVTAGDYDLGTPDGRLSARIVGAVARKESEDKSRRIRRKHLELAETGKVSGGGRRPFGYERDRVTIRPDEAAVVRDAIGRVIAGESLRSITLGWQGRGIETVTGAAWSPTTVRRLLSSGRIAGMRAHHGKIVGPAEWPAIVDADDAARARAILTARSGSGERSARSYLLTGFLICGKCGTRLSSAPVKRKGHAYTRYACPRDRGGCGGVGIAGAPIDAQIVADVLSVLSGPNLDDAVAAQPDPDDVAVDEVAALESRMAELAEMFAAGEVGRSEWITARDSLDVRLTAARSAVASEATDNAGSVLVAGVVDLEEAWEDWTLEQRRAVVGSVVERITIAPTTKQNNKFDPERITIGWKA